MNRFIKEIGGKGLLDIPVYLQPYMYDRHWKVPQWYTQHLSIRFPEAEVEGCWSKLRISVCMGMSNNPKICFKAQQNSITMTGEALEAQTEQTAWLYLEGFS